jgi:hypothetical protein
MLKTKRELVGRVGPLHHSRWTLIAGAPSQAQGLA